MRCVSGGVAGAGVRGGVRDRAGTGMDFGACLGIGPGACLGVGPAGATAVVTVGAAGGTTGVMRRDAGLVRRTTPGTTVAGSCLAGSWPLQPRLGPGDTGGTTGCCLTGM